MQIGRRQYEPTFLQCNSSNAHNRHYTRGRAFARKVAQVGKQLIGLLYLLGLDSLVYHLSYSVCRSITMRESILISTATALLLIASAGPTRGQQNGEQREETNTELLYNDKLTNDGQDPAGTNPTKVQYVNVNGLPVLVQFTYVGPPKILPIATADSYPEGSLINLICTVSGGQRNGLNLKWMKDGEELDGQKLKYSGENLSIDGDDGDISIMKIKNATHTNSGKYTCTATNPLGQDSTSVNIVINGMFSIATQ